MGHKAIWAPFFLPLAWCPHHQREISVVVGEDTNNGLAPCGCQGTIRQGISRSLSLTLSRSRILTRRSIFTTLQKPTQVDIL